MSSVEIKNEDLMESKIEELNEQLDRFAGLAMQSLMQHWVHLDENGGTRRDAVSRRDDQFSSLASAAMFNGWGDDFPNVTPHQSYAEYLASDAYYIALSMLKVREEFRKTIVEGFHKSIAECFHAQTTKEATSTEDAGRVHDDGGSVLDVHSLQSSPDVSQVGSPQTHSGDVQATKPE